MTDTGIESLAAAGCGEHLISLSFEGGNIILLAGPGESRNLPPVHFPVILTRMWLFWSVQAWLVSQTTV